ncbi:HEAT repeat domain-containing protein [Microbacterium thalassium]|uniref:HEAT repeat protein n=1 Tax=Microbacterium thalassium TaxID=362649 RepID=A0A7X0FMR9_9MICO|nr:HEAT repeat domain-containing protein [Microbacterium thalassium]MBB6390373.1 HEAT repeat protein [Microbacterium thalassium]GLK25482.1 hypothetical protein GCM10017607_28010 [Microbacterium thalassium]
MTTTTMTPNAASPSDRLRAALAHDASSARLQAALAAGTAPDAAYVEALIARCAVEPDFFVRDMLTWALLRHPAEATVTRLLDEARSQTAQARSQALHTLSKIGDPRGWAAISAGALADPDDVVAATAWRAAVRLVPSGGESALAADLAEHFGRGDRDLQLSLSRALVDLGEPADAAIDAGAVHADPRIRAHAIATRRLREDPDTAFDAAIADAKRFVALANAPTPRD